MNQKDRRAWRKKNLNLVYFGNSLSEMASANNKFWHNASVESKHQAMREFVHDELERLGMSEYGPKLLRLTATFRPT